MSRCATPEPPSGEEIIEVVLDLEHGGARPVWWMRRRELCWDMPAEVVDEASYDFLTRDAETLEALEADTAAHHAIGDLIYDRRAPAGIPAVARLSAERIARANERRQASVTRRDAAYWIARERIAAVANGIPVEHVAPSPLLGIRLLHPLRPRRASVRARQRATRRHARRLARPPDDPSRPRPSRQAAGRPGRRSG